jgi:hypothetical protein
MACSSSWVMAAMVGARSRAPGVPFVAIALGRRSG